MSWAPFPPSRESQCCSNRSLLMPNRWVALVISCDRQECMLLSIAKTCELTQLWVYPLKNIFSQSAWNFLCLFCLLGAVTGSDSWHIPRHTRLPYPPSPMSIVILDAVPITFQDGKQVRIMGLVHDSALNGQCGVIIKKLEWRMSIVYCVKLASWALSMTPH